MAISRDRLGAGEHVVYDLHTHIKELLVPFVILLADILVLVPSIWMVQTRVPEAHRTWALLALAAVALVVALIWFGYPLLRWKTTSFTFTNRRIITQRGILSRSGHDLPLARINDVSYEKTLIDRILGCGTLVLQTAAEDPVILHDIPNIERVHTAMTELLFDASHANIDDE